MQRRTLLKAGAVSALAALASRANAQQAPAPDSPEGKHIADTLAVGTESLASSKYALQKASAAKVKEFAKFETDEQTTIGEILKPMAANPPPMPGDDAVMKMLPGHGAAFDREYVKAQTEGHQKLLAIQETYLKSGKDPVHTTLAKLASGQIKEHLALLTDLSNNRM